MSSTLMVALTGYGQDKDRQAALNAGFDLHITKPVNVTELLEMIKRVKES